LNHNPWISLPDQAPYVLAEDRAAVEIFNTRAKPQHALMLELLPEPWMGRLDAPVVVLALNPGYSPGDHQLHADPRFRSTVRATLAGESTPYPFYYLAPSVDSPGHRWCQQRLKALVTAVGEARPDADAAQLVANRLLWVEWFPYHSISYAHNRLHLPSRGYTIELVWSAIARGAVVVIARSERMWVDAIPELKTAPNVFRISNPQYVSISPKNLPDGFRTVVSAIATASLSASRS